VENDKLADLASEIIDIFEKSELTYEEGLKVTDYVKGLLELFKTEI
jgi:hypothetical protein